MKISKGFSLIELMIVVAIIAILAAVVVPSYKSYILRAKTQELLLANSAAQDAVTDYITATVALDCSGMPQDFNYPSSDVIAAVQIDYTASMGHGTCFIAVTSNDSAFGNLGENPAIYSVATILSPGNLSWDVYSNGSPSAPSSLATLPP